MYDVINIVPKVVIFTYMSSESTLTFLIKGEPFKVANIALVFLVRFHKVLLLSKLSECVNNNTKKYVVQNNLDNQEETNIEYQFYSISLIILILYLVTSFTYTTTSNESCPNYSNKTFRHSLAPVLTNLV